MGKVSKICEVCGNNFTYYLSAHPNRRFCSNKCMGVSFRTDRLGMKFSLEHRKNLSISHKGMVGTMKGKHHTEEAKQKISKAKKGIKHSREHIRKCLQRNPKSSLEIKFENIINKFKLPYKFVGDGSFLIERKCPDFINTNGEKIAIEVYCRKHKEKFRKDGVEGWKANRKSVFQKHGWNIEFFNEIQVNEEEVLMRLI